MLGQTIVSQRGGVPTMHGHCPLASNAFLCSFAEFAARTKVHKKMVKRT